MVERRSLLREFSWLANLNFHFPIATALRRTIAQGYSRAALRADVLAGIVVGIVALPLSMALAIAVGVPPQHGLYTAIVAGALVPLTGGSKFQVTGPTAAFVVILAPIAARSGLGGLLTAGMMAGMLLIAMGAARFGQLVQFIPHPVTTGFTAGIATVIAVLQLKDVLGLTLPHMPETFLEKLHALWQARATAHVGDAALGAVTLALLIALPRLLPRLAARVPAPLVAIVVASLASELLIRYAPSFAPATIGTRFHSNVGGQIVAGIPQQLPMPQWPWGAGGWSLASFSQAGSAAFAIALLGAIESLLSATIADSMTGKKHDPDAELIGLGIGNIVAPFFGGIAATGALARTATNVRAGAVSPIAAVVHALVILVAMLLFAPLVAHVPMAALAGLLLLVAWNMSERRHFANILRIAPKSDVLVLLICYGLTVLFDMVVAVLVGVVLAALLFMKRTAELTQSKIHGIGRGETEHELEPGIVLYEIAGPLFFGAAQRAMSALEALGGDVKVVVVALGRVPSIDATGFVALESALNRLGRANKLVVLAGPLPEPRRVFDRANLPLSHAHLHFTETLAEGMQLARTLVANPPRAGS